MPVDPSKALQFETEFLSGVEAHFEAAKGKHFRGTIWRSAHHDDEDRLRALMAERHHYDRERLKNLPANRRIALHGFEKRLFFWRKPTGVAIASVLNPLSHYVSPESGEPPPIALGELTDHIRRLVGDRKVPHIIGVCSPTGFTDEARRARLDMENVVVVLVEPRSDGGWRTTASGDAVDPRVLRIFDPEGTKHKQERVLAVVEEHRTDLLIGGLSVSAVARIANVPEELARQGFEKLAAADPELRVVKREGEFLLFRGAPVRAEKKAMNVIDRIRQMFSGDGDTAQQINLLAERRALLAQRRDRIYEDIAQLENRDGELLEQGKAAKSAVPRRRLAAQLAQLRKDIARQNTTAGMLNQQINIISTDIHNLTLIQQGRLAELPDTEVLTEHAVQAEEMLETLRADSDMVSGLEMGMEQTLAGAEEAAILREFEAADEKPAAVEPAPPAKTPSAKGRASYDTVKETPPAAPQDAKKRQADPEAT